MEGTLVRNPSRRDVGDVTADQFCGRTLRRPVKVEESLETPPALVEVQHRWSLLSRAPCIHQRIVAVEAARILSGRGHLAW
jgi:hypothetical protein